MEKQWNPPACPGLAICLELLQQDDDRLCRYHHAAVDWLVASHKDSPFHRTVLVVS